MRRTNKIILANCAFLLLLCIQSGRAESGGILLAQADQRKGKNPSALSPKDFFFTEPYAYLHPPERDLLGMSLELDYALIKYDYGFVNLVDSPEPPITFRKRYQIKNKKQLARVMDKSGFKVGDRMTVVSAQGTPYSAVVAGFSYVGNSPSTIIVTADLKIEAQTPDPTLFTKNGIALRGARKLPANPGISSSPPLPQTDPLHKNFFDLCTAGAAGNLLYQDPQVVPAVLKTGSPPAYFVSFWQEPKADHEIEDIKIGSCLFLPSDGTYLQADLAAPLQLIQVYDLDGNGNAELFGLTGDGTQVCLSFLVPVDSQYLLFKQGLCSGY